MRQVRLKVSRWLTRDHCDDEPTRFEEFVIEVGDDESILGLLRRFASKNEFLYQNLFRDQGQLIRPNIVLLVNGRITNPYDPSTALLNENDEMMILSFMEGG